MKAAKRSRIIYWIATIWLSLGMVSTGIVQLIPLEEEAEKMTQLGYPLYFLTIIGTWKLLGVLAILLPRLPLIKEWAYAGFFFLMSGAILTHLAVYDDPSTFFGPSLLILLTLFSWYLRPSDRQLQTRPQ